jgi:hypothetical protein
MLWHGKRFCALCSLFSNEMAVPYLLSVLARLLDNCSNVGSYMMRWFGWRGSCRTRRTLANWPWEIGGLNNVAGIDYG